MKLPILDWLRMPSLRLCSPAAVALWAQMIPAMVESPTPGHLVDATGDPLDDASIAKLTGVSADGVSVLVSELVKAGILAVEGKTIVSPMVRREMGFRRVCSLSGKAGAPHRWPVRNTNAQTGHCQPVKVPVEVPDHVPVKVPVEVPDHVPVKVPVEVGLFGPPHTPPETKTEEKTEDKKTFRAAHGRGGAPHVARQSDADQCDKQKANHPKAVQYWCDSWQKLRGVKYPFNGGKDAKTISWMLAQVEGDLARFQAIIDGYLASVETYVINQGHSLGVLRSQFSTWYARAEAPQQSPETPRLFVPTASDDPNLTYEEKIRILVEEEDRLSPEEQRERLLRQMGGSE
ncbi:hypothetical protein [Tuwongella immobilis]|uniref:Uncharacterized protein n=1 Tax=Tuwongella immobilis TaxID=692036 RepID=A0A6C2YLG4_9BACT|nr:hypothetical protein [Tuwongella immobilis]VIP02151.1 unnamed protein product [Tuwongella immobilis]VIP05583.1 unnamed protein product [Tuwongella immobilis]VTS00540.1 unnamed protein product [Tuwongella immobilis]VTS08521.1 unnamed protein product [Tuwongella immobilis]